MTDKTAVQLRQNVDRKYPNRTILQLILIITDPGSRFLIITDPGKKQNVGFSVILDTK